MNTPDNDLFAISKQMGFAKCCSSGECEKCAETADLYFGNTDYWESREGDYWCGKCVLEMHLQNEKDDAEAMARECQENGKDKP
jgi:hypothetical protein